MVEPQHVYVMPENAILSIEEGRFSITQPDPQHRERKPFDVFFSALARDQGEYALGIILSGGDSDGTLGVKAIKERGGLTIAQVADGSGPRNPDMPTSAISSGMIDIATTAEEMGARLLEFSRTLDTTEGVIAGAEAGGEDLGGAELTGEGGAEIDHVELFVPGADGADSRSFVLCPGKAYDRSPCGTML